jgi:hypothetical protein
LNPYLFAYPGNNVGIYCNQLQCAVIDPFQENQFRKGEFASHLLRSHLHRSPELFPTALRHVQVANHHSTRLPMNTKIILELTPEQIRFLRYVAELEGLTVEQYLLRFAKGQIVHPINSRKS